MQSICTDPAYRLSKAGGGGARTDVCTKLRQSEEESVSRSRVTVGCIDLNIASIATKVSISRYWIDTFAAVSLRNDSNESNFLTASQSPTFCWRSLHHCWGASKVHKFSPSASSCTKSAFHHLKNTKSCTHPYLHCCSEVVKSCLGFPVKPWTHSSKWRTQLPGFSLELNPGSTSPPPSSTATGSW